MDIQKLLREHLRDAEGTSKVVYDDVTGIPITRGSTVKGYPTIGCGRNLQAVGLRDDEIDYLLGRDISDVLSTCRSLSYWPALDPVRQLVVADLVFNLGIAGWRKFVRANDAITRGDYAAAAAELVSSKWYAQVGRRGKKLADAMRTGTWTRSP